MKLSKKIGSAILAGVMTLSLAVPAFAASAGISEDDRLAVTKATEFEIEMEGLVYTPVIRVQVLSKGAKVYLNPSNGAIAGKIEGFSEGETAKPVEYDFADLGVASTPIMIRSDSDGALTVNANVTITAPTGVSLTATKPTSTAVATKDVYVQVAGTTDLDKTKLTALDENLVTAASANTIKKAGEAQACSSVATIKAAAQANGDIIPQYGAVMLQGKCSKLSTGSWGEADAISATVVLTFSGT